MSEEEKKAIARFKANANYCITSKETTKIILDLIEKQQKEIEELKEDNKHQWEERCKLTFELENSISKDKIKEVIKKYYNDYEEQKSYRYTLDVEEEQSVLKDIEKELLEEK